MKSTSQLTGSITSPLAKPTQAFRLPQVAALACLTRCEVTPSPSLDFAPQVTEVFLKKYKHIEAINY
jgi:hypothetical protein